MLLVNIIIWFSLFFFSIFDFIYLFIFKNIARYCLDNSAHVDSLNKDGNTPLFCAAERLSSSCGKVKRKKFLERIYWFFS
jgi:hypothetical protein